MIEELKAALDLWLGDNGNSENELHFMEGWCDESIHHQDADHKAGALARIKYNKGKGENTVSTVEEFTAIFDNGNLKPEWKGCNAYQGLTVIQKYIPKGGIEGAEDDKIYSVQVTSLLEAGITVEDVTSLKLLNWMIEDAYLCCLV